MSQAHVIDGKKIAADLRQKLAAEVTEFVGETGVTPGLAVVLVGDDPASQVYVRNKTKAAAEVGLASRQFNYSSDTDPQTVLEKIDELNADPKVHGILVQLPLPRQFDEQEVIERTRPEKDVDGFHPMNVGRLLAGLPGLRPCTPLGCLHLLAASGTPLQGAEAVVVGRSNIVGKPTALLLLEQHATVTLCHSKTKDLPRIIARADVLIAAVGRPRFVEGEWIKPGATVIDVGINRTPDGKLCGDVDYDGAASRAAAITPVPGGVGPMTIAYLLGNTLQAARVLAARSKAADAKTGMPSPRSFS